MKSALCILILCISAFAQAAAPSAESIDRLLIAIRSEALMDLARSRAEEEMGQGIARITENRDLTAQQRRGIEELREKVVTMLRTELGWKQIKPLYVQLYVETFDQSEVDGLIVFYESPIGKSYVSKMPQVLKRTTDITRSKFETLSPRIDALIREGLQEVGIRP